MVKVAQIKGHFKSDAGNNGTDNTGTNRKVSKNGTFSILGFGWGPGIQDGGPGLWMRV